MLERHRSRCRVQRRWLVVVAHGSRSPRSGIWSFARLPIDAVPDITNVQVQINTEVAPALAARGRAARHVPDRDGAGRPAAASSTRARSRATGSRR